MGNQPSVLNETIKEPIKEEVILNQEEIFNKILEVSNNLLIEYNNEFLKEDFCNKIAVIYEKKLSNFNIKILKNIYSNINSPTIDNEMLLTLQYMPKNDEEFITETFKDNLNEKFWNEKINIDPEILFNNAKNVNINNITSSIKSQYYINPAHVNNLLQSINKINTEFKKNNIINDEQKGGSNNNETKKKELERVKLTIINNSNKNKGNNFLKQFNSNNKHKKERLNTDTNNTINNNRNNQNNGINNNEMNNNEQQPKQQQSKQQPKQQEPKQQNPKQQQQNQQKPKQQEPKQQNQQKPKQKEPVQEEPVQEELNIQEPNLQEPNLQEPNIQEPNNINTNQEELNKVTNNIIANTTNIPVEENIDNKIINDLIKYYVPKKYQSPTPFCKDVEKCKLSKKDLCTAISENFIVRNNIIAAILTTIPFKNSEGFYEGGICFQKFMNLKNCNVCVPYDYREFKNKDIKNILTKILDKADNLDELKCKENQGYFLKLSTKEIEILTSKIANISEQDINNYPKIKYNYYFIEFIKKLQNNYLQNLNALIIILDKIKESPIINNTTLNLISDETKKIIDNMYNTCHYYYIYGIISLISSDITEDIIEKNSLSNVVSKALDKK